MERFISKYERLSKKYKQLQEQLSGELEQSICIIRKNKKCIFSSLIYLSSGILKTLVMTKQFQEKLNLTIKGDQDIMAEYQEYDQEIQSTQNQQFFRVIKNHFSKGWGDIKDSEKLNSPHQDIENNIQEQLQKRQSIQINASIEHSPNFNVRHELQSEENPLKQQDPINEQQQIRLQNGVNELDQKGYSGNLQQYSKKQEIDQDKQQDEIMSDLYTKEFWLGQQQCLIVGLSERKYSDDIKRLENEILELTRMAKYSEQLLASVSHDFKTPLNGILLIIELLVEMQLDQTMHHYIRIVKQNAYLLLYMINDLLDYSRMKNDQLHISPSNFLMDDIIQELMELFSLQVEQKNIDLQYQTSLKDLEMFSDPNRIKQILINLISNALKFTNQGSIKIIVEKCPNLFRKYSGEEGIDQRRSLIKITIQDTGVGIPAAIQPQLFKMYATFDHNNGSNKHGVGLGLTICKSLIGLLGPTNEMQLSSEVGIGTIISFLIYRNCIQDLQSSLNKMDRGNNSYLLDGHSHGKIQNHQFQCPSQAYIFSKSNGGSSNRMQSKSIQIKPFIPQLAFQGSRSQNQLFTIQAAHEEISQSHYIDNSEIYEDQNEQKQKNLKQNIIKVCLRGLTTVYNFQGQPTLQKLYINKSSSSQQLQSLISKQSQVLGDMLIVDDQVFNVMAFKFNLQKLKVQNIDEAYDGQSALLKVDKTFNISQLHQKISNGQAYKYIFMDLTMPILDGYQTCQIIKEKIKSGEYRIMHIIAISGFDDEKTRQGCYDVGFDAFISKPVKFQNIISVIEELRLNEQDS